MDSIVKEGRLARKRIAASRQQLLASVEALEALLRGGDPGAAQLAAQAAGKDLKEAHKRDHAALSKLGKAVAKVSDDQGMLLEISPAASKFGGIGAAVTGK